MAKNIEGSSGTDKAQGTGCECKGVRVRGEIDNEGNLIVNETPLDPNITHSIHLEIEALQKRKLQEGNPTGDLRGGGNGKTKTFREGWDKIAWNEEAAKKAMEN